MDLPGIGDEIPARCPDMPAHAQLPGESQPTGIICAPHRPLTLQVIMPGDALYTDLSGYYDLMCADIDYRAQSHCVHRLQQLFGNGGTRHLTWPAALVRTSAISSMPAIPAAGSTSTSRCWTEPPYVARKHSFPAGHVWLCGRAAGRSDHLLSLLHPLQCRADQARSLHRQRACRVIPGGLFCFNAVDKRRIDNASFVSHTARHADGLFTFSSGWHYPGKGSSNC